VPGPGPWPNQHGLGLRRSPHGRTHRWGASWEEWLQARGAFPHCALPSRRAAAVLEHSRIGSVEGDAQIDLGQVRRFDSGWC
jgi:hypothetical protein